MRSNLKSLLPYLLQILYGNKAKSVSNAQSKKLRQMTITVTLITINELLLFTVPDVCLILNPSTNTFFFFLLNMSKGNDYSFYKLILNFRNGEHHYFSCYATRT